MADEILTRQDDATSIVGEELATELEENVKKIMDRTESLVTFSETSPEQTPQDSVAEAVEQGIITPEEIATAPVIDETGTDDDGKPLEEVAESLVEEATKTVGGESYPASDFLVVEDPKSPSTWHLQVKKHGKPDHGLMGAAKAALTSPGGHRGNKYAGPGKQEAISKLKALYAKEKMDWEAKSDAEWESEMWDELQQIKSLIVGYNSKPSHQLDTIFDVFKSEFDNVVNSEMDVDNKLHSIQDPFNKLGSEIVANIRSSIVVQSEPDATDNDMEAIIAKAVAKAVNPLNEKLAIMSAQLQTVSAESKVPARRGIQPAELHQVSETSVNKSSTPKLRALINKTVG